MVDRIKKVMEYKELNKSSFARTIGIDPSRMTHIFNGHNEPTLDMVRRIVVAFPDISSEWLISGVGNMVKGELDIFSLPQETPAPTIKNVDNMQQTSLFDFDDDDPVVEATDPEDGEDVGAEPEVGESVEEPVEDIVEEVEPATAEVAPVREPVAEKPVRTVSPEPKVLQPAKPSVVQTRNRSKSSESHIAGGSARRERISNSQADKKIVKIVFFYDDRSFEEYRPS